jgi:hypothetical protein
MRIAEQVADPPTSACSLECIKPAFRDSLEIYHCLLLISFSKSWFNPPTTGELEIRDAFFKLLSHQSICSLAGQEVKGEGCISCDTIIQISRQNSLAFIMESVHLINADDNVGFYEFFILWYVWKSIGESQTCKGNVP